MSNKIDFVITWVDGNDIKWLEEKKKYMENNTKFDISNCRYRDWDILKYWFRSVERYAPWVNKIYFVTAGHYPNWLNLDHPKIQLVHHSDILPKQVLPTFNSNAIEMGIENIPGLSEQFVYFNDDMFINDHVKKEDFFYNGLPCDSAILSPIIPKENNGFYKALANTIYVLNRKFNIHLCIRKNWKKWYNLKYGKNILRNIIFSKSNGFPGFYNSHIPNSYLKSVYSEAIHYDEEMFESTIHSRFRNNDNNFIHWIAQYWQFASGKFYPRKSSFGKYFSIAESLEKVCQSILNQQYKLICINDTCSDSEFEKCKKAVIDAFEKKFPNKSSFEKGLDSNE